MLSETDFRKCCITKDLGTEDDFTWGKEAGTSQSQKVDTKEVSGTPHPMYFRSIFLLIYAQKQYTEKSMSN